MANRQSEIDPRGNRILAGLSEAEFRPLESCLEPYDAEIRTPVYEPGRPMRFVHFPVRAVFSLVAGAGEQFVEVSTIGNEGMVGLPVFLGARVSPNRAFCQIAGSSLRLDADQLPALLEHADGGLHRMLHRYTQATIVQLSQSVACNQLHSTQQRAARWLLMTRDRVSAESFTLTQEFIAQMLGVRRATVSEVAAELQSDGIITYSRGRVTILEDDRLLALSCECYKIVRDEYDRLLNI